MTWVLARQPCVNLGLQALAAAKRSLAFALRALVQVPHMRLEETCPVERRFCQRTVFGSDDMQLLMKSSKISQ